MSVTANLPREELLFYVAQDFDEDLAAKTEAFVSEIARARNWVIGPPRFVNEDAESKMGRPAAVLGGILELYSAKPLNSLAKKIDKIHLEEVCFIVDRLKKFTAEFQVAVEFELGDVFIGAVEDGKTDPALEIQFLGEWRRYLKIDE